MGYAAGVPHTWGTVAEVFGVLFVFGIAVRVVTYLMDLGADAMRRRLRRCWEGKPGHR